MLLAKPFDSDELISEACYLAAEKTAEIRHEYQNGKVYAMAGF